MAAQPQPTQPQSPQPEQPECFARVSRDEQEERVHNAATFADIPRSQMPWELVRLALKVRALSGYDCYAYRPAHQEAWVIWDRQPDPATDARYSPRAWAIANGYAHLIDKDGDA